jgi:membrane associated rhomboid family serine protease
MFPLKDHNPTYTRPVVTIALVLINVAAFLYEMLLGDSLPLFVAAYGVVPYELSHLTDLVGGYVESPVEHAAGPAFLPLTLVTSMFLHGSVMHIFGNMLYLWIFGNNVEDTLGHVKFLLFYLACGLVAGLTHVLSNPSSTIPTVGASGAVAGVLGAYFVTYPRARVLTLVFLGIFIRMMEVPASVLLLLWFVMQSLQGFLSLGVRDVSGGVAWFAHIGGFVAGAVLVYVMAGRTVREIKAGRYYAR